MYIATELTDPVDILIQGEVAWSVADTVGIWPVVGLHCGNYQLWLDKTEQLCLFVDEIVVYILHL